MAKKIFVIGGNGFVGKNLFNQINFKNFKKNDSTYYFLVRNNIVDSNSFKYLNGDFYDKIFLADIFLKYNFDEVWHLLSTIVPSDSDTRISTTTPNDLMAFINLLDLIKVNKVSKLIFFSSAGAINNILNKNCFQEDIINSPTSVYAISKLVIENYIKYYSRNFKFNFNYKIYRISNLYGKHHNSSKNGFINIYIRKLLKNETIQILGNGSVSKDFLYISDFTRIFWKLHELNNPNSETLNIGRGNVFSLNEILIYLKKSFPLMKIEYTDQAKYDLTSNHISLNKLKTYFDFKYSDLEKSIEETILWEKNNNYVS